MDKRSVDVTTVVVSYNSAETLERCLRSLQENAPQVYRSKIVVVDNASMDGSADLVRCQFPDVMLIECTQNLGFGQGNNLGMIEAPARYYYLHNSDAYLQTNILDDVIAKLDFEKNVGIAGLPLVYPDLSPQTAAYSHTTPIKWILQGLGVDKLVKGITKISWLHGVLKPLIRIPVAGSFIQTHSNTVNDGQGFRDVDWVCGASMVLREEVRSSLGGGFDPAIFLYGEDEDICIEAKKLGWRVVQAPVTPVIHEFGWGKHRKQSKIVAQLKADSLKVFVDKHFHQGSVSWWAMNSMLWMKRKAWGVK